MAGPKWESLATFDATPAPAPAGNGPGWESLATFDAKPAQKPEGFAANALDFIKSIPRGLVTGATSLPNSNAALSQDEQATELAGRKAAADTLKASLPAPQGSVGRFGEAVGEGLGNPLSYVGPGSLPLKIGGAILSSAGSEGAGQATEGTAFEKPARIAGALAGGVSAGKMLGPTVPKAAIPTSDELFNAGRQGYAAARNSGLEVSTSPVASWATRLEQELIGPDHGFTGGPQGVAPKTFGVLASLQAAPDGAIVTASNIDALRKNLGRIAGETQPAGPGGAAKPTADAAAASIALKRLSEFTENLPEGAVVAGDAANYVRATKEANGNWGAGERTRDFDTRLTKADNAADRQIAGSLDAQIKQKAGQLLDNPKRLKGLTDEEIAQLQLINSGDWKSNTLRQLGRGGAGVIPILAQLTAAAPLAAATGGWSLGAQAALASGLYGARKGAEAMTKGRARDFAEMLAMRSPEYERRVSELPPVDTTPQAAALARSLLLAGIGR